MAQIPIAHYIHGNLYQYDSIAVQTITKDFNSRTTGSSAQLIYNTTQDFFHLTCPQQFGPLCDRVLGEVLEQSIVNGAGSNRSQYGTIKHFAKSTHHNCSDEPDQEELDAIGADEQEDVQVLELPTLHLILPIEVVSQRYKLISLDDASSKIVKHTERHARNVAIDTRWRHLRRVQWDDRMGCWKPMDLAEQQPVQIDPALHAAFTIPLTFSFQPDTLPSSEEIRGPALQQWLEGVDTPDVSMKDIAIVSSTNSATEMKNNKLGAEDSDDSSVASSEGGASFDIAAHLGGKTDQERTNENIPRDNADRAHDSNSSLLADTFDPNDNTKLQNRAGWSDAIPMTSRDQASSSTSYEQFPEAGARLIPHGHKYTKVDALGLKGNAETQAAWETQHAPTAGRMMHLKPLDSNVQQSNASANDTASARSSSKYVFSIAEYQQSMAATQTPWSKKIVPNTPIQPSSALLTIDTQDAQEFPELSKRALGKRPATSPAVLVVEDDLIDLSDPQDHVSNALEDMGTLQQSFDAQPLERLRITSPIPRKHNTMRQKARKKEKIQKPSKPSFLESTFLDGQYPMMLTVDFGLIFFAVPEDNAAFNRVFNELGFITAFNTDQQLDWKLKFIQQDLGTKSAMAVYALTSRAFVVGKNSTSTEARYEAEKMLVAELLLHDGSTLTLEIGCDMDGVLKLEEISRHTKLVWLHIPGSIWSARLTCHDYMIIKDERCEDYQLLQTGLEDLVQALSKVCDHDCTYKVPNRSDGSVLFQLKSLKFVKRFTNLMQSSTADNSPTFAKTYQNIQLVADLTIIFDKASSTYTVKHESFQTSTTRRWQISLKYYSQKESSAGISILMSMVEELSNTMTTITMPMTRKDGRATRARQMGLW